MARGGMMDRDRATATIQMLASGDLAEEIRYLMELDGEDDEEQRDELDAFEEIVRRLDEPETYPRSIVLEARRLAVRPGIYREITDAELSRVYVSRGAKYDFKMGGRKYVFDRWITDGGEHE